MVLPSRSVALAVERIGCLNREICVDFTTEDETATAGEDYGETGNTDPVTGTLTFGTDVTEQMVTIPIIDDNQWEPDETFRIKLSNPRLSHTSTAGKSGGDPECTLRKGREECVVTIIDDDEPGSLGFFDKREYVISENCGTVAIDVFRSDGADGEIGCDYETIAKSSGGVVDDPLSSTAQEGIDYKRTSGTLLFKHQEMVQTIEIEIYNTNRYDKNVTFQVVLTNPTGGAKIYKKGGSHVASVQISNDGELAHTVNSVSQIMQKRMAAFKTSTSTWGEQFVEAFVCEGECDEEGEDAEPVLFNYVMHFFTIFWKVLFAFIPPTDYCGGWLTFVVSLIFIGIVTGVVGAVAEMFGCFVGLKDSITAITFVALGTSLPDTFASKSAAMADSTADAAIGNVTGSNSVNVFLGLGLPWVIAAVWASATGNINHKTGEIGYYVPKGSGLSFSVAIFCCEAVVCILGLCLRRRLSGGELGGSLWSTRIWAVFFVLLWVIYVTLSTMVAYGDIATPTWI